MKRHILSYKDLSINEQGKILTEVIQMQHNNHSKEERLSQSVALLHDNMPLPAKLAIIDATTKIRYDLTTIQTSHNSISPKGEGLSDAVKTIDATGYNILILYLPHIKLPNAIPITKNCTIINACHRNTNTITYKLTQNLKPKQKTTETCAWIALLKIVSA